MGYSWSGLGEKEAGMKPVATENSGDTDGARCDYQDPTTDDICGKPGKATGGTAAGSTAYACTGGHAFVWPRTPPEVRPAPAASALAGSCPFCPRAWRHRADSKDGCGLHFWSPVCESPGCENPTEFVRPRASEVSGALDAACLAHKGKSGCWFDVHGGR
jgi:hypothetical protein